MLSEDKNKLTKEQQQEFIEQAYVNINHLERIIYDLLSATELDGGKVQFLSGPINLFKIAETVVKRRRVITKKKKINLISYRPKFDLPLAMVNPQK